MELLIKGLILQSLSFPPLHSPPGHLNSHDTGLQFFYTWCLSPSNTVKLSIPVQLWVWQLAISRVLVNACGMIHTGLPQAHEAFWAWVSFTSFSLVSYSPRCFLRITEVCPSNPLLVTPTRLGFFIFFILSFFLIFSFFKADIYTVPSSLQSTFQIPEFNPQGCLMCRDFNLFHFLNVETEAL